MSVPHYPMFIDGEWVDSLERYEIRSPATDELVAHRHFSDAAGGAHRVAFLQVLVGAHDDRADRVLTQVEHQTQHAALTLRSGELEQLTRHGLLHAVDARNAVAH